MLYVQDYFFNLCIKCIISLVWTLWSLDYFFSSAYQMPPYVINFLNFLFNIKHLLIKKMRGWGWPKLSEQSFNWFIQGNIYIDNLCILEKNYSK